MEIIKDYYDYGGDRNGEGICCLIKFSGSDVLNRET